MKELSQPRGLSGVEHVLAHERKMGALAGGGRGGPSIPHSLDLAISVGPPCVGAATLGAR